MDLVSMGPSQCGAAGPGGGTSETSVSRDQTPDLVTCQPANIATELVKCESGNIATELFISEAGDYNITGTHHQVKIITLLAFIERFTTDLPSSFTSAPIFCNSYSIKCLQDLAFALQY